MFTDIFSNLAFYASFAILLYNYFSVNTEVRFLPQDMFIRISDFDSKFCGFKILL